MPFDRAKYSFDTHKINIGINASGLLWTEAESFNLKVNYKKYCEEILNRLCEDKKYQVHLIWHAYTKNYEISDNDFISTMELSKKFPNLIVAPDFSTPMDVKSYISNLDFFTGARMHATIAAFSSGVPVIPFSYSRKFEGLFSSLDYDFLIDGTKCSTDEAVAKTFEYIENRNELKRKVDRGLKIVKKKTDYLLDITDELLSEFITD